ncbi:MAG: type II secretion system protein [Phycisphaerales bacterium]|nr:MAG: type II secretion system protein [Phycisphaerales bacterium]
MRRGLPEAFARSLRSGFSLVELIVVMSILIVVMSLAIGAGSAVIEANRRSLQQASFEILDQVLEDFARQNLLKAYLDEDGAGQLSWKGFYGKYPPMDLSAVRPGFNSGAVSEDMNLAGRNLHQRIMGQFTTPIPGVLPGARLREGLSDASFDVASTATAFAHDDTESFLFYVQYYSPANAARLEKLAEGMVINADEDWVDLDNNGLPEEGDIALNELRDVWGNPVLYINDCRDRFDNVSTSSAGADGRIDNPLLEANNGKPVFVSPGPDGYFTAQDVVGPGVEAPPTDPLADNIYSIPRALVERLDPAVLNDLLRYDFTTSRWKPR